MDNNQEFDARTQGVRVVTQHGQPNPRQLGDDGKPMNPAPGRDEGDFENGETATKRQ